MRSHLIPRLGLMVLVATVALLFAAGGASATPIAGSVYDSQDGDQLPDVLLGVKDWSDVTSLRRLTTNVDVQATDDCFIGGVKENTPNDWSFNVSAGGCVPGKSDLIGMWSQSELTPTKSILHAAFVRTDASGNTFLTFELNRVATRWTNAVGASIPCRSNGDLLLAYDVGGGTVAVTIYRWTGDGTGPAACPNGANGSFAASAASENGLINTAGIANWLSPDVVGATIPAGKFGEAQIDVGAVLASMGVTGCFSYIQAQAHTRSSSSISSALIDNVPPIATKVANCAVDGTVYDDADRDGTRDAGEAGLPGQVVYVDVDGDGTRGAGEPSAATDAEGYYLIPTGLTSGTYETRVEVPESFICTQPALTCAYTGTYTAAGENSPGRIFGLYAPASVSGRVYLDANANGTRDDAEALSIAGATIYDDADGDGEIDGTEPQTTVAPDGTYVLTGLSSGAHTIRVALPAGYEPSGPVSYALELGAGESASGRDFGGYQVAVIRGHLYDDTDGDGAHQAAEPPTPGQTVRLLLKGTDTVVATTSTGADGAYSFAQVTPGEYDVQPQLSGGRICSAPSPCTHAVTVASGETSGDLTFTSYLPARLAGAVRDAAGGAGIAGRVVTLEGVGSTTTGADGSFAFEGLAPGTYHVTVALPAGWECTSPDPCRITRGVSSGDDSAGNDFTQRRIPAADLSLSKSAPATVVHGETFAYTLTAINAGPDPAVAARVVDELPPGVELVSASPGCADETGTITCSLGDIAAGADASATITVRATAPGDVRNAASVSSSTADPNPAGDADTADVTVTAAADVRMEKTGPASVAAGATADYTLTVTNEGPSDAEGVVIRDTLPAGLVFDADASDAGWTQTSAGVYEIAVGTLADGASVSRKLVARASHAAAETTAVNTGVVAADTDDPAPANDEDTVATAIGPSADLQMTKTAADAAIAQGETVVYTLEVSNAGPSAAADVTVTDVLPSGMTFVALSQTGGPAFSCATPEAGAAGTVECTLAELAAGAGATFEISARGTAAGDRVNTASVASSTPDGDGADNADSATVAVAPSADVSVEKTGPATVGAGEDATYTLTARNSGPSDAHDVTVTDTLPEGLTLVSATPDQGTCTPAGQVVSCALGTLSSGAATDVVVVATAQLAAAGQVLTNSATIDADEQDPDAGDRVATADTTVGLASDLELEKTASVAAVPRGGQVTYTLKATNRGPSAATGVEIRDPLPAGMSLVSASPECAASAGTVTCALGTLANAEDRTVTVTVRADAEGTSVNTAGVSSDNPDPDDSDDEATATVEVGPAADLDIDKTGPATVKPGGEVTYTLTVRNDGPSTATGVTVTDELPPGLEYVAASASQGACTHAAGTVVCELGAVADGATATVLLDTRVPLSLAGRNIANTATVRGDDPDPDPSGDAATHDLDVGPAADLVFSKTAAERVVPGGRLVYDLRVENQGPHTAEAVEIVDVLPEGVEFVSVEPSAGSCSRAERTVTCALGDLQPGGAAAVTLAVDIGAALAGADVRNRAEAASATTDLAPATNADDATTAVDDVPTPPATPEQPPAEPEQPPATAPPSQAPKVAPAGEIPLQCGAQRLVLVDVFRRKGRVQLLGVADRALAGSRVAIVFEATGKVVANAQVAADGWFRTTAPLPPRSQRTGNRARYVAVAGAERSLNLKLHRRMIVNQMVARDGKIVIAGRVTGPLARGAKRAITVTRRVSCTRSEKVGKFRPRSNGTFRIAFDAPRDAGNAVYRLSTRVRKTTSNPKTFPTYTLPRPVNLPAGG